MLGSLVFALTTSAVSSPTTCAVLPAGGVGKVATKQGIVSVDADGTVRLDGRSLRAFGREAGVPTIRAACGDAAGEHVLIANAGSAACPVRYQIVEIAGGDVAHVSRGFGSCVDGATAVAAPGGLVVTMPAGPGSAINVSYRYAGGALTAVAAPQAAAATRRTRGGEHRRVAPVLAYRPVSEACLIVARRERPIGTGDIVLAEAQRVWPVEWRSRGSLRSQPFTPLQLRRTVTDLACLSALPSGDRVVTRMARALFESRRHGAAAFEQLDDVARSDAVDPPVRAVARTFHAQMRFEVEDPRYR